jgi:predicted secreted protein
MATFPITITVTDANGLTQSFTAFADTQAPPVISNVTVVPQSAPAGTSRTVTVTATGAGPLSYTCNGVTNSTGVFQVVV